ncbi:unnamed protein product [Adineta steineri]|uniref:Large ribosomal subunit protein mL42 n=1 Tax=Adineta steineri TaxID=433720 RepID=A0A819R3T3_9BILA|nr:unnamed protein product [Adineta steineri]CAF4036072.1 unnamed protein product [Adineta steineri]
MYRTTICLRLISRRISTTFSAFASSDSSVNLPNPCIAMAPDTNHIICYHPEKSHPYEYTKPIDRTDPSFAQSEGVFNIQAQRDYDNRFYKKQVTKKDYRLETEQLSQMFNEHPALFKPTPKRDKIRRAPQFAEPAPDRSGL